MKQEWIQCNREQKCPECGKFTLETVGGYEIIGNIDGTDIMNQWDVVCSNCNAKFYKDFDGRN